MKILLIFGTRPEAIKMCPLINELKKEKKFDIKVCVTGQHREMLDSVLKIFNVKPDYDLNLMKPNQSIIDITTKVMHGVDSIIKKENPELILVHGDTTTTMASSVAAFYNKIKVGHIEAGLRSNDLYSPYPEEFNRKIVSSFAEYHFCPTEKNKKNLLDEGIDKDKIYVTGNTVIDALLEVTSLNIELELYKKLENFNKIILITTHRRENQGKPMENIFNAIKEIALKNKDICFIFPMHKNPKIREKISIILPEISNVFLIEPLEYVEFVGLMKKCDIILTDSGGIQEEAPALGIPVLVLREETERPEAVKAGTVKVIGTSKEKIKEEIKLLLENSIEYDKMSNAINPYGVGNSCKIISNILAKN